MADSAAVRPQAALPPHTQLLEIAMGFWRDRALTVAAELELADQLAARPLYVEELAARTKTNARSLFRVLRALETIGVFKQVSPRLCGNTEVSEFLRKDIRGSVWTTIRLGSVGGGSFEAWTGLLGAIQTGQIAFEQIHGYSRWEFLQRNPKQAEIFNEAMRSLSAARTPAVTAASDWSRFPVIADIGGGIGTQLVDILNAHSRCKGILFDQPEVIAQAIPHDRIERVSGSFFERLPSGADAYILRSVIHDWADAEAVEILKTVCAAAKPESRVILIELIIDDAPENARTKWQDLLMMVTAGGQEREAAEYQRLLETAGLELEQIVPTPPGLNLIISRRGA
jgi:hypothetical protein